MKRAASIQLHNRGGYTGPSTHWVDPKPAPVQYNVNVDQTKEGSQLDRLADAALRLVVLLVLVTIAFNLYQVQQSIDHLQYTVNYLESAPVTIA